MIYVRIVIVNFLVFLTLVSLPEGILRLKAAFELDNLKIFFATAYDIQELRRLSSFESELDGVGHQQVSARSSSNCSLRVFGECINTIYTLGGSTTAGGVCSSDAGSWPEFLAELVNVQLVNLAQHGQTDDDMSVAIHRHNIESNSLIIFASRANLGDQLFLSQPDFLNPEVALSNGLRYVDFSSVSIGASVFGRIFGSMFLTLRRYSLIAHKIFEIFEEPVSNGPARDTRYVPLDNSQLSSFYRNPRDIGHAGGQVILANYAFQLSRIQNMASQRGSRLIVLTLPNSEGSDGVYIPSVALIEAAQSVGIEHFIDTSMIYRTSNEAESRYLCDTVHQTRMGNILVSNFILNRLLELN